MPCSDGRQAWELRTSEAKRIYIDKLASMLCGMLTQLEAASTREPGTPFDIRLDFDLAQWWADHKEWDDHREKNMIPDGNYERFHDIQADKSHAERDSLRRENEHIEKIKKARQPKLWTPGE